VLLMGRLLITSGAGVVRRCAVLAAALACFVVPGVAQAGSCVPPVSAVFAPFGDTGSYFPLANSGFESGSASWALSGGAAQVAGDATTLIGAKKDAAALSLPAGSSASSAFVCVEPTAPSMRFMLKNTGAASSKLGLDVLYTDLSGKPGASQIATFTATSAWAPSPITYYYANLLALATGGTTSVAFRFHPLDATGVWSIDDVYVDPLKRKCC
jgi:hypothetical protein